MTAFIIVALIVAGICWALVRAGSDHTAVKAEKARAEALQARVEVDRAVTNAASGGAADLAALARASGLQRPGE